MPKKQCAGGKRGQGMGGGAFRSMVENANDMIQSVGAKGNLTYANKAWLKTLGYKKGELKVQILKNYSFF